MKIEFEIPGKPFGKQRPRFNSFSKRTYTPAETINYENLIKTVFVDKYPSHVPTDAYVQMDVLAIYPVPESWSKKKKRMALEGSVHPGKPDIDNLYKVVADALNHIAYHDDAQVYSGSIAKRYGETPRLIVSMTIEDEEGDA